MRWEQWTQELRVEEFSVQKLRESHETIHRLTSQVQEITGKNELYEWFWRFPWSRVKLQWTIFTFQSTSKDSKSAIFTELRQTFATWNMDFILVQGLLSQEMKNELGAQFQCQCLREGRSPWRPLCQWKGRNEKSSKTTSWWSLSAKIKRKSWDSTKAHFSVAGNARPDEFYEWFRRISRSEIESQWKIVSRSQSTSNDSKFSFHAEPRQTPAIWYMELIRIGGTRFWQSIFYIWFVPQSSSKNSPLYDTKRARISSTSDRDRTSLTRDEEQNRGTIPMPTFARRPPTMSSLFPLDIQQISMVGQPKTSEIGTSIRQKTRNQVTTCCDVHRMLWCGSKKWRWDSSRSIAGKNFPNFEMLDAKIVSALNKIVQNSQFKKRR